jgi:hypothetical protein
MKQLDRRWKVLLVTGVAVFMAVLDGVRSASSRRPPARRSAAC